MASARTKKNLQNKIPPPPAKNEGNLWALAQLWEWGSVRWEGRRILAASTYVKQQGGSTVSDWGSGPTWAPHCSFQHINHPKQGHHSSAACWETHQHRHAHSAARLSTNNPTYTTRLASVQTVTHTNVQWTSNSSTITEANTHRNTHAAEYSHNHTRLVLRVTQTYRNRYPLPTGCPRPRPSVTGANTQWVIFTWSAPPSSKKTHSELLWKKGKNTHKGAAQIAWSPKIH